MPPPDDRPRRFILGVTGASGAAYALRFIEQVLLSGAELHVVASDNGRRLLADEAGITRLDFDALAPALRESPRREEYERSLLVHSNRDVGAVIASGSFLHDGMAVLPCSSATLGMIASGAGPFLLSRAAMVCLKERRPLIVCHRETPLSLIDIENMRRLTLAGAVICPTNPGLYLLPTTVGEIVDFIAGKVLDLLKIEHRLGTRWEAHPGAGSRHPAK